MMKNLNQGEIWWVEPTPKMGSEQRGRRPALIIQNDLANHYLKTTIIVIISCSGRVNMPEMVDLGDVAGLSKSSVADFAQIFTIDRVRLISRIGKIGIEKWVMVEKALQSIFLKTI